MPTRQSGSPWQQCIGAISAFVDSIDSHIIILRMIHESKMKVFVNLWESHINLYNEKESVLCIEVTKIGGK